MSAVTPRKSPRNSAPTSSKSSCPARIWNRRRRTKCYEKQQIPIGTLTERVRHIVQCAFAGRRIVIFSGGAAAEDEAVFQEATAIRDGGGFGSIIGRNSFQRKRAQALEFLNKIMTIYAA